MKKISLALLALVLGAAMLLTGCNSLLESIEGLFGDDNDQGYHEAGLGKTMSTTFFDYSIDNARMAYSHDGIDAPEGVAFVIVDIKMKNTTGQDVPMWLDDFYIHWGNDDDDELGPPSEDFVEEEYYIELGETVTKTYVFEVPAPEETTTYGISFVEIFTDETVGDYFMVNFKLSPA